MAEVGGGFENGGEEGKGMRVGFQWDGDQIGVTVQVSDEVNIIDIRSRRSCRYHESREIRFPRPRLEFRIKILPGRGSV